MSTHGIKISFFQKDALEKSLITEPPNEYNVTELRRLTFF
jgi:hypothetical protein